MKYEYVSRNEYQPIRNELEEIIKKVQNICRELNKEFTFQFKLVGSGSRHLITRVENGNTGYDFDYNLILNNHDQNSHWKPSYAKRLIMDAFQKVLKGTNYNNPQDSTSAITIKVVDRKNKRIIHSCDFAIVYNVEDADAEYYKYIRFNKAQNNYTWEIRKYSKNINRKLNWLKEHVNGYWELIKKEYLKVKNANNDKNKHSFQLYYESICNVYNWYKD